MNWIFSSSIPLLLLNGANSKAMYHFLSLHLLHYSEWNTICDKSLLNKSIFVWRSRSLQCLFIIHWNLFIRWKLWLIIHNRITKHERLAANETNFLWPASRSKQRKVNFKNLHSLISIIDAFVSEFQWIFFVLFSIN